MTANQLRRLNLQRLVDDRFEGNQTSFGAACTMSRSQVHALLNQKNMGPTLARKIESLCQLAPYWLDQDPAKDLIQTADTPEVSGELRAAVDTILRDIVPNLNRAELFGLLSTALTLSRQPPKK